MAKFSDRLKELRKSEGMSQEELAKRLQVSRSCIGNYEQGLREPDYEDLEIMADLFNVDMAYLKGKTDIKRKYNLYEFITDDERLVLEMYRTDNQAKEFINRMLAYAKGMIKDESH